MKQYHLFIIYLISLLFIISSCSSQDDDEIRSTTYYLCREVWVSFYYDYNVEYRHTLQFYKDGSGKETFTRFYFNQPEVEEYTFIWRWTSNKYTSIEMEYGSTDFLYFEGVSVGNRLTGILDGDFVQFDKY